MRAFSVTARDGVSPESIVKMATTNSAQALGLAGKTGELVPGAFADMIVLPLPNGGKDFFESVVHFSSEVAGSMINGAWVLRPAYLPINN